VIIEALALGCPVVSTDCVAGPREILDDGRLGQLVPVGDAAAMADAIVETLDKPPPAVAAGTLDKYRRATASARYLRLLGDLRAL
jgi:glycosyltransferase involved in cell wall biosynthesis